MKPGVCFTKVFRTELGHKYILVECSVIALGLPIMSKLPVINSCAINKTMIGMSIKRISVLNLCHVLKPVVKSTPGVRFTKVFRTDLGHKYILVECSVIALCLPVMSKITRYKLVCYK